MKLFFLRSIKDNSQFIHPVGLDVFSPEYGLDPGAIGACCFTEQNADMLINENTELEKVNVNDFLKTQQH